MEVRGFDMGPLMLSSSGWWWEGKQEIEERIPDSSLLFPPWQLGLRDGQCGGTAKEGPSREFMLFNLFGLWKSWSTWVLLLSWHLHMQKGLRIFTLGGMQLLVQLVWSPVMIPFGLGLEVFSAALMQCQLTSVVTHSPKLPKSLSTNPRAGLYHAGICMALESEAQQNSLLPAQAVPQSWFTTDT